MLRPFPGPPLKQLPQFGGQHADELLWGTYRPGYYLGAPWVPGGAVLLRWAGMSTKRTGSATLAASHLGRCTIAPLPLLLQACACGGRSRCWLG